MTISLFASLSKTKAFSNGIASTTTSTSTNSTVTGSSQENGVEDPIPLQGRTAAMTRSVSDAPAFPPTAVQFYSSKSIDLAHSSIVRMDPYSSLVAPLTYQSMNLSSFLSNDDGSPAAGSTTAPVPSATSRTGDNSHLDPDFGIWNCYIVPQSKSPSKILQECHPLDSSKYPLLAGTTGTNSTVPIFLLVLDLDYSNLGSIHPVMETMLENIVDYCSTYCPPADSVSKSIVGGTTRFKTLLGACFGRAPLNHDANPEDRDHDDDVLEKLEEKNNYTSSSSSNDGRDDSMDRKGDRVRRMEEAETKEKKEVYMHLVVCAILPSNVDVTYREKQALNLVSYHLQKFASEVNCTLCFMRDDNTPHSQGMTGGGEDVEEENKQGEGGEEQSPPLKEDSFRPKGLTVREFARYLSKMYQSQWSADMDGDNYDDNDDQQEEGSKVDDITSNHDHEPLHNGWHQQPSFYGPFDYDVDLINSVLLRGAGCPGVWNANTDSLWVALPSSSEPQSSSNTSLGGDKVDGSEGKSTTSLVKGDQEWLEKLAESVNVYTGAGSSHSASEGKSVKSSMDQTVRTTKTTSNNTVATKKKVVRKKPSASGDKKGDSQDVQDFFAGLLNK